MKLLKTCFESFILVLLLIQTAYAGHFADAFREFVLGPNAEAYSPAQPVQTPSGTTEQCMGCHDGGTAVHITIKDASSPMDIRGFQTVNHPVGMDYARYALKKPNHYTPSNALPPEIRLEDGRVTCISCHQLSQKAFNREGIAETVMDARTMPCMASGKLTVGPRETDLCMACHTL